MSDNLNTKRFTLRLSEEQWGQLDAIAERESCSLRLCLDLMVSDIPEEPEELRRLMRGALPVRRKWGKNHPRRGVSISLVGWEKLVRLANLPVFGPNPEGEARLDELERKNPNNSLHARLNYSGAAILRAALGPFVRNHRPRGDCVDEFLYKPVAVDGVGRELYKGLPSLNTIPKDYPVLIDHSILLLAALRLKPAASTESGASFFDADPFRPMSEDCAALIRSASKRAVLIHPIHLSLFLSELALLVKSESGSLIDDDRKPTNLLGYLVSKARQLDGLELRILRLACDVKCELSGGANTFSEKLALISAKGYLGDQAFAFATAFHPTLSVEGVKVFCPDDLPKRINRKYYGLME